MSVVELPPPLPSIVRSNPQALNWPAPHRMRVIETANDAELERALVTLNDHTKLPGVVLGIDFERGTLELRLDRGPQRLLPFASFRSLFLLRKIELETIPRVKTAELAETRAPRVRRKCTIVFNDASLLEADVVSVMRRSAGLFLVVVNDAAEFLRWFVPAGAIANYRVGPSLGQSQRERGPPSTQQPEIVPAANFGDDPLPHEGLVTRAELELALLRQHTMSHLKLGDALVDEQLISIAQRDVALALQSVDRRKLLGEILVEREVVTREEIRRVLVEQLGMPAVNLARFPCDPNAIKAVSAELARKYLLMPLYRTPTRIVVGIENPLAWEAQQEIEFFTGLKVDLAIVARADLLAAIAQFYDVVVVAEHIDHIVAELGLQGGTIDSSSDSAVTDSDNTLVRMVNKMIIDAADRGASDIHIESRPGGQTSRVRFRIDGVLAPYINVPPNFRAALVSRLKIMSVLDISERRRPQDGKIRFENFGPRRIELRVVTMPTTNGLEDVVMRILASPRALTLDQLALPARMLTELRGMAERSFGLIMACGPTGSGKTTTLHALLAHINTPQRKIWTVEDPIEISQDGLCQVQVNQKLGLSFPEALRSLLRADPDVIMVGEMRDAETARTVIAASLTGHLVLSTMHTNSAVESVVRLLDLGLDPFNFSDALLGVVGQRLVRRLCGSCRASHQATVAEIDALAHEYCAELRLDPIEIAKRWRERYGNSNGELTLYSAVGCARCDRTGYKGRMAVQELLTASAAIKAKIQAKASSAEILHEAVDHGMVTLEQDAIEKILQGHLDFKQVQVSCL